jgi:hypothetical protein
MKKIIITNNPAVKEKFPSVLFVQGSPEEVLIKVRNLVYSGYELISHPLSASLRMMFSPFRTVILGKKVGRVDFLCAEVIEESINKYRKNMLHRDIDNVNRDDYKIIDLMLLESSMNEPIGNY